MGGKRFAKPSGYHTCGSSILPPSAILGELTEPGNVAASKADACYGSGGSNPSLSAIDGRLTERQGAGPESQGCVQAHRGSIPLPSAIFLQRTLRMTPEQSSLNGWVILEIMGHRRLAGHLTEQEVGPSRLLRIDVPADEPTEAQPWKMTQFYGPSSVFCITPVTEETARAIARRMDAAPVQLFDAMRYMLEDGEE